MIYWICYFGTKLLSFIFFPVIVHGRENVPKDGGFILACNHISYLDPMVMGIVTGRRLNYLARDTLFHHPVLGFVLTKLGTFPVKRNTADKKALKESLHRLKLGLPLLLFPEGTRHGSTGEKKVEAGVGFLAIKGKVQVVPVFISGSEKVLPAGTKFLKRNRITVRYGKPIAFDPTADYEWVAKKVMDAIYELSVV